MKHLFGYASVFALAAGFSLSSCSSDDAVESAPDFSGNGEAVKTQFSISVPGSNKSSRMTQEETQSQETPKFQGMNDIHVFTFKGAHEFDDTKLALPATLFNGHFTLDNITTEDNATGLKGANAKARIYEDVKFDLGVDHMLFYGKSAYGEAIGKLNVQTAFTKWPENPNVSFINFVPQKVYVDHEGTNKDLNANAQAKGILAMLNGLYGELTGDFVQFNTVTGKQEPYEGAAIKWVSTNNAELDRLYTQFKTLKNGSADIAKFAATDLYVRLTSLQNSLVYKEQNSVNQADNNALAVKKNIITGLLNKLTKSFDVTTPDGKTTLAWNSESNVKNDKTAFPADENLPAGVAILKYDQDTYSYVTEAPSHHIGQDPVAKNSTLATDIVYPAALYYYAHSDLTVADKAMLTPEAIGNNNWAQFIATYPSNNGSINMNTRSVSMVNPVNYGVAQLRTKVRVNNAVIHANSPENDGEIAVNIVKPFKVTGILVGGQKAVDWKFEQSTTLNTVYTIYDNVIVQGVEAKKDADFNNVKANPTLVLESKAEEDVYIAVEFENTNEPFLGVDGLVKTGAKFYLVAPLKYTNAKDKVQGVNKIFQKDYYTNANLTIKHLKNAYITIPDLRAPQMEFGLSVDLTWQKGLTFETDFD